MKTIGVVLFMASLFAGAAMLFTPKSAHAVVCCAEDDSGKRKCCGEICYGGPDWVACARVVY